MAERGAGGDWPQKESEGATGGAPERSGRRESSGGAGVSTEQIMQTGDVLLRGFIMDRVQRSSATETAGIPELGVVEQVNPSTKKLCECLRRIGDELDGNMELQRMIEQVQGNPPREVFLKVATEMFSDGNFNWGRVVALFYFASKLVLKALWSQVPQMIRTIIDWTMDYLRDHVVQWIRDQGGWEGLLSYFGTPTLQTVGVFVAGLLTATFVYLRYS
ncbi:apoptosis regulator BAX [Ranitomeya variabilis]|uniref:apoptosis regulator BAX n=1 Tax=Ranitomeya variabilis TaxID=490064 RepID=UPI004055BE8A